MVDARAALYWNLSGGDILQVAVWGKNLSDKEVKDFELPLGDTGGFQGWAAPRTYGLELRWSR